MAIKYYEMRERAAKYVKENEKELRKNYGDSYVAVHAEGKIVDWDVQEERLTKRVGAVYVNDFVLINTIDGIINDELKNAERKK